MTYFCSIGSQILYIFETHGIGQTPSSLERYLVLMMILISHVVQASTSTSVYTLVDFMQATCNMQMTFYLLWSTGYVECM